MSVFEPHEGKARTDGPDTSRDAARACRLRTGTLRYRVLLFLAHRGAQGATDSEIETTLDFVHQPRRQELVEARYVEDSGRRRPTPRRVAAEVWVITGLGREALAQEVLRAG